jgi:hypothetical protein
MQLFWAALTFAMISAAAAQGGMVAEGQQSAPTVKNGAKANN